MKYIVKFLIFFYVLLIACNRNAFAWRSFKIVFNSFLYEHKAEVIDVRAQILNTTDDTTLNVFVNILEDVNDVDLNFALALETEEGNFTALVNRTLNFCKFLNQRSQEPLLRLVYEDMLNHGNFMKSCPIKKGAYALRDYRLDEEVLPSYVPETNFIIYIKFKNEKQGNLFNGTLTGIIDKSKGFDNLKLFSLG